ncbi:methylated-DNA--[protein]-cysteine S-methyltransferase [Pollutimonas harenae]|nr:methylated-DNA--[protein]-cysteine S-methyltransferase [Pollutimonas harenae]
MKFYAQINSPLGAMLLSSNGTHLEGLYFAGQNDCPIVDGLPAVKPGKADPTAGMMAGAAIKNFKAYKTRIEPDLFNDQDLRPTGLNAPSDAGKRLTPDRLQSGAATATAGETPQHLVLMQTDTPDGTVHLFEQTQSELKEYFDGSRQVFTMPIHLDGTEFQKKVWQALLTIPYGEYVSYGDVALAAGLTAQHGRPVGTAVGRNPLTIIVPCHRVLASSGRLNGYTGGLERKFALLELEGFTLS